MGIFRPCCQKVFTISKRNMSKDTLQYCLDSVRRYDYENFVSTLLLDKSVLTHAIVIRAFNVEIARVQDQVSDKNIGLMRFQFWIEALDKIASSNAKEAIPAHPVAQELYKMHLQKKMSKRNLTRLIVSRKSYLDKKYFLSLEDMEKYAEESVSPVYYSILESAGIKNVSADHVASHLGKAQGIVNMLRSVEYSAKNKIVSLPQDILMKYKISQEAILRSSNEQNLKDVIFEVATRANQHLSKARSINVPSEAKRIFLPAVGVDTYLKKLQKKDFFLFDKSLNLGNSFISLKLYWYKLLSKY
ncbi:NADH dehydrogenase (ubiquinone) complex I, assembly factor 6 homolog sicily [Arctopsyche grandis]|uniref:NADH dehydrogenase (ubiquinone) complex I, assembly factor 6 homolog sicily n=1 Tax=Arctopsyche grandis TaxID=121162 RepID=UPI00406D643C